MRAWPQLTWPRLAPFLAAQGFASPDLMITDSALMLPLWRILGEPRLVYRVTDRNASYPNRPASLDGLEVEIASAAELVVYTGRSLGNYVAGLGARDSLCIANGVDTAHFAEPARPPAEYSKIPAPRAVYVGTVADWFDADLIAATADQLPQVSFVIIGPGAERLTDRIKAANIHCLGPRPYAEIPAYLQHAAVGLIPFRRDGHQAFVDAINPLKLYEYMAAGLPVVSTAFEQVVALASPAAVPSDAAGFIEAIAEQVQAPGDGMRERAFAKQLDWSQQFAPLAIRLNI